MLFPGAVRPAVAVRSGLLWGPFSTVVTFGKRGQQQLRQSMRKAKAQDHLPFLL
jgi:hypothetical protein